jgi:hypothetical protein
MAASHWNRSARRSGGQQPARIVLPRLSADAVLIIAQRERIRAEFGEGGVRAFDKALREKEDTHAPDSDA